MSYNYLINGELIENIVNPTWSDDLDNFANTFSFSSDSVFEVGSLFQIATTTGQIVLKGIITDFEQTQESVFRYSGFDSGFYINQNEVIEQFKSMKISEALKRLCKTYEIPVGNIPEMSATVTQIFKDKKLSEIFKTLIDLAISKGSIKDIYYTCAKGKFEVLNYETITDLTGEMGTVFSIASEKTINAPSIKVSLNDLRNRVLVADNSSENLKHVKAENSESIKKYGLLQEVETVDTSKTNNLSKIANDKLKELNKLSKTISMNMLGNWRMHKGVIMPINSKRFGVQGLFLIKSSTHTITGTREDVAVSLEKRE